MPKQTTGIHSPETLKNVVARVNQITAGLEMTAETVEMQKIGSLVIKNDSSLKNALDGIARWMSAVHQAVNEKMNHVGAFGKSIPEPEKAAKGAKKRPRRGSGSGSD